MVKKTFNFIIFLGLTSSIIMGLALFLFVKKNTENLPDYEQLREYTPIITTRLYASDGALITEYSKEKRVFVPIENIPKHVANAFIAAEDSSFYQTLQKRLINLPYWHFELVPYTLWS